MWGFKVPSAEAEFIGNMALKERTFAMAALSSSSYPDEEVAAFGAANPAEFRVTRLSRITLKSTEKEAEQVMATVRGGVITFEDAARTHSQDSYTERGGDMGSKMDYELAGEIPDTADRERVINLKPGEISPLIKVPGGWAFFRAEDTAIPADITDPASLANIRSYIEVFNKGVIFEWLFKAAESLVVQIRETGFDDALAQRGLEKRSFGPLPLNYGDTELFVRLSSFNLNELIFAVYNEYFWKAAFSTPLRSPSEPLELGDYVVILYPLEENDAENNAEELKNSYASNKAAEIVNQNIRFHFITSKKLEDHFDETYSRFFQLAY